MPTRKPKLYETLAKRYPRYIETVEALGKAVNEVGPLDEKTLNLVQLAAAAAQRVELLWLPTYAPWTNPIEKLWLKLKQEVVVMHRYSARWPELKQRIADFLGGYDRPSPDLLRFVGLGLPI